MFGWLLLAVLGGYGVCAVAAARCAYVVQRAALLAGSGGGSVLTEPSERFRADDREHAATCALLFGLLWPVTVPGYLAYRGAAFAVTAGVGAGDGAGTGSAPTGGERRADAELTRRRIQQLEQELELGPGPGSGPGPEPGWERDGTGLRDSVSDTDPAAP